MPLSPTDLNQLQRKIWEGSISLEIRLSSAECRTFDQSDPYLIQVHRLSYFPFLLAKLHAFFSHSLIDPDIPPTNGWFSYESVALKWHYPIGLLFDLYARAEPASRSSRKPTDNMDNADASTAGGNIDVISPLVWKLTVHFTNWPADQLVRLDVELRAMQDAWINSVKEADFVRNGTAKAVMSLSKDDTTTLWRSIFEHNLPLYNSINQKLINPVGTTLRHIPLKIYLPSATSTSPLAASTVSSPDQAKSGHLRVVQALVTPTLPTRHPQTIGTALYTILPKLFPSKRNPLLAQPVLHGAALPLSAPVEDLVKAAAYPDGWLHVAIVMMA